MTGSLALIAVAALLQTAAYAPQDPDPLLVLQGKGVQIYHCDAATKVWVFDHPEADLLDTAGKVVGHHGAGPSWRYKDGSSIHGEVQEKTPAPEAESVPWLKLRATRHQGTGVLSDVEMVRRTETHGGFPSSEGCDADHGGTVTRVPYSATYSFYPKSR